MLIINQIAWLGQIQLLVLKSVPEDVDITTRMLYRPSKHWGEYRKEIISTTPDEQCYCAVRNMPQQTSQTGNKYVMPWSRGAACKQGIFTGEMNATDYAGTKLSR